MFDTKFTGGLPETLCGRGSTLASTAHMRPIFQHLLWEYKIKSLLDAPCGDFNWMATIDLAGIDYLGLDISADNLAAAWKRAPQLRFLSWDIVHTPLPSTPDMMLCHDFHQHLTEQNVRAAFANFKRSTIPWMLASSHQPGDNSDIPRNGGFRKINLQAPPYNFPPPQRTIPDPPGSGRFLCLWHRDQLPE